MKAKWTNPDGTMKKGYRLAPNGKESRLTEEQWLLVRTPNFKKWFGDWEKSAYANATMDFLEKTAPVKELSGQEFQKDGVKLTEKVPAFFKSINNVAHNEELGDVVLDLKGVEDSVAHGVGRLKAAAFMAVPEVIEKGFIFNRENNWKERGWDTAVIVAPVKIAAEDYVCEVVVKKVSGQQRFYLHEVEIKKTLDGVFKSVANNGNASQVSKLIIGKHLAEVKGNVSQVVDENGEPLVVYHGTESDFYEFKHGKAIGSGDKFGYLGEAFYATNDEDVAQTYGDRVIPIFLNLKNPYVVNDPAFTSPHSAGSFAKSLNVSTDKVSDLLKSQGYDGVIAKDEDMDYVEYAVYNSNQIKSATDNVGTYSENPDIRWSIREDSEAEKIDRQHRELYERYKNGDEAAYEEAAKLVSDYAESKGYPTDVYHGTGADGFNVAKADASVSKYGEGNQAHGMGLYLATQKSTSERYQRKAKKPETYTVNGKVININKMAEDLNLPVAKVELGLSNMKHWGFNKFLQQVDSYIKNEEKTLKFYEKGLDTLGNPLERDPDYLVNQTKSGIEFQKQFMRECQSVREWIKENLGEDVANSESIVGKKVAEGKLFEWRTNLKPENVLDEDKTLNKQNDEIQKKFKKAFDEDILPLLKESYGFDEDEFASAMWAFDFDRKVRGIVSKAKNYVGADKFNDIMLKHGIKGITYDGRLDGRCYVSFEGGSAVKLQDPFTFDDNGELIPLSERFDTGNPDMRWSIREDSEAEKIDRDFRELYDEYKNSKGSMRGHHLYNRAVLMVADYAKSKGYAVRVYHGTGSDGFNVADASGKHFKNGEGAQAHGKGLYLALAKTTAENYRDAARDRPVDFDKVENDYGITPELLGVPRKDFDEIVTLFSEMGADETIEYYFNNKLKPVAEKLKAIIDDNGISTEDFRPTRRGKVFEWFTNLKKNEILYEDKRLSKQPAKVKKAVIEIMKEAGLERFTGESALYALYGRDLYYQLPRSCNMEQELLKRGIRGIAYEGWNDGKSIVSFEGGSAVKLQDPFTFDDNGELIPLSERFDEANPDMRWRDVEEQIKTPQFKEWFGKSQVVDKDGKPLRVYHGTTNVNPDYSNFDVFKGKYHFFSSDRDVAGSMGSIIYTCFLRIENPLIIDASGNEWGAVKDHTGGKVKFADLTNAQKKKLCKAFDFTAEELESSYSPEDEIDLVQASVIKRDERSTDEWADYAKANGYDGVIFRNLRDGAGFGIMQKTSDVFVVFKSTQIKDATGENNGDFSNENPSIKWKDDGEVVSDVSSKAKGKILRRLENKISELMSELKTRTFNEEEKGIISVITGNKKYYHIRIDDLGNIVAFLKGSRDKTGANHIILKHYGVDAKMGYVSAEEILEIGKIIRTGKLEIIDDNERHYSVEDKNYKGRKLTVVVKKSFKKRQPDFVFTFYSNKKAREVLAKKALGQNPTGLSSLTVDESSTDGVENQEKNSRLRYLLRQERTENPVIWASIVLAKEILNGRGITRAKVEKLLPTQQFDGSKQNYAVERAQRIAEKTKATQKQFSKDLDVAIRKAESNLYWQDEFVENAYRAFSKGGEEYGFAKQRLMQYLKDLRNKELNKVKGYETDDFDVDLVDAILKAQEAEPERASGDESKTAGEEVEEELEESGGAFEGDDEFSGKKTPLAPSKIRDVIGAIRREVVKRVRDSDGDQKTLDEKYRKTLVNVLTDAMKELVYGKEREDIGRKIEELKTVKHAVITVKDGERVGQKIDNFTLRAENIALRIFKRGVRDSKKAMTEKLDVIFKRRGKKPSRMQRDDKRSMTGLVQQRIYNISKYVEMDAEALEDVRREAVAKLENVDENFVQDAEKGKIREDVEDVRAEVANVLHDIEMFGGWADKSRAEMAQALEFLEKTIDTETAAQKERVEKRKERNVQIRKIISDALKMSGHNASRDGGMRIAIRKVLNGSLPFDSFLGLLGESATGEARKLFEEWRKDFVARVDRAANAKANEVFQTQQKFIKLVEDSYSADFHDALKRLLEKKGEYEKFSKPVDGMRQPMSLANVIQLYVSAAQKNYERNFYEHRAARSPEYKKLQDEIDEIQSKFPERSDKTGAEWEDAKARIEELEKKQAQMREGALADYLKSIEALLSDGDRRFIDGLRQLYKDALPSISAVAKRVIGLPIEQADALYMPVKVKRSGNLGEGVPQVPVVPKSLSQRVPHLRDLDETADPISLFTDRVSENAQFKHFSELYIEMRGIFGDGDLQDLIKQRCGADVLTGLKEFIADIATGKTRGPQNELLRKTNGLTAVMLLGFNLGSGVRQVLPGVASFAPAIGGWKVFKNMMSFFTPEGFAAAREICRSDTGRRRFEIGNMQIMEELLSTPDQNKFWAAYKRHALFFNRFADKLSIMFVGQGIYRSGIEEYLRKGFSEAEAKKLAMSDMWQIAERTQASGRTHNMSHWR